MTEQAKNLGQTTLAGNITSAATSLSVTSAANFPTSTPFHICACVVDSLGNISNYEIMQVTNVAGTTFTVTRAQESTTAVAHTAGEVIANIFTAGDYLNLQAAIANIEPGGSNTQVQYNNNGVFAGSSNFTFNSSTSELALTTSATNGVGFLITANSLTSGSGLEITSSSTSGANELLLLSQTGTGTSGNTASISTTTSGNGLQINNTNGNGTGLYIFDNGNDYLINAGTLQVTGNDSSTAAVLVGGVVNPIGDWENAGYTATGYGDILLSGQLQIGCDQAVGGENFPRYSGTQYDTESAIMSAGDICIFSQSFSQFGGVGNVFMGDNYHSYTGIAGGGTWISSYPGNNDPVTIGWDVLNQLGAQQAAAIFNYNSGSPLIDIFGTMNVSGALNVSGYSTYSSDIQAAAFTSDGSHYWALKGYSASIPVATGYVEVIINGTPYYLSASTSP